MHQAQVPSFHSSSRLPPLNAATEPIGGVSDSIPIHPEHHPPTAGDRKKPNSPRSPRKPPSDSDNRPHPDPDHLIDEYA